MAFLLLIALFALAWIVLILPKQRELKRHNALVASLEVGDEVMTGSGFYGTLTEVDADTVRLLLAEGFEVKLARRAVAAKVVDHDDAGAQRTAAEVADVTGEDLDGENGIIDVTDAVDLGTTPAADDLPATDEPSSTDEDGRR